MISAQTVACDSYRGWRDSYRVLCVKKGDISLTMAVANRSGLGMMSGTPDSAFTRNNCFSPTQPLTALRRLIRCCH
jgi:hypothetical protein